MRNSTAITTILIALMAMTATSCYTQLKSTYESDPSRGYYSGDDRSTSGNRALEERRDEVVNEEDYTLGYEDGWEDAESYYFKDYEAQRWYENYGATLAHDPYGRDFIVNHYYGWGYFDSPYYYHPYYSHYYPHYHPHSYWSARFRWHFSVGFLYGSSYWHPRHGYYSYYAYPGYYPYYGDYWGWGYHYPYYGVVVYNGNRGTSRNYGPRGSGLISRGSGTIHRTRSEARVRNTANRSSVRSDARSAQVSRSRGTVNRSSSTDRSRSSTTVRSRSGSGSSSRGTVNRGSSSSGSRGSSGTVNRGRSSSSNRSTGTVNRSRSSSGRGSGGDNQSLSSSNSRTRNIDSDGVVITRGTSIIRHRESNNNRNSVIDRRTESDPYTRVNRSSSVNSRIQDYNDRSDSNRINSQSSMSRRERSIQSLRSRLIDREVESPRQHYSRDYNVQSSRSSRSSFFNNNAVRQIYKHVIGNSSGSRSSSSVGRSSSSSRGRSSSVSRSGSSSSSRSTVRSSSSSSSSRSRGSSSSSRSRSSSRDRN